jgi:hypothetical protein
MTSWCWAANGPMLKRITSMGGHLSVTDSRSRLLLKSLFTA